MKLPAIRLTLRRLMAATAVIAVYLSIYRSLVYRDLFHGSAKHRDQVVERYDYLPRLCPVVFDPANRIDRAIRPSYWSTPTSVY